VLFRLLVELLRQVSFFGLSKKYLVSNFTQNLIF
jgi:hypothetical protein